MNKTENLMTVADVSKHLKVTQQYVRKLISAEKLIAIRLGNQWVINPEDLALCRFL